MHLELEVPGPGVGAAARCPSAFSFHIHSPDLAISPPQVQKIIQGIMKPMSSGCNFIGRNSPLLKCHLALQITGQKFQLFQPRVEQWEPREALASQRPANCSIRLSINTCCPWERADALDPRGAGGSAAVAKHQVARVPAGLPVEGARILRAVSFISRLQGRSGIAPNCIAGQSSRDRSWCELEGCTRPAAPQGEEPGPATIIKNATIYHQLYLKRMKTSSFLEFTAWLPSLGFFFS